MAARDTRHARLLVEAVRPDGRSFAQVVRGRRAVLRGVRVSQAARVILRGMRRQDDATGPAQTAASLEVAVVISGVASGGAYAVLDVRAPAGMRIPPHVASFEDDTLLVLEGELEVHFAAGASTVGPGECFKLVREEPRRICVLADTRFLVVVVPAGIERLAALASEPAPDPDDVAALLAVAGVRLLPRRWGGGD